MFKLIVGLGNPGERYAKTRHNAGFWFLEALACDFRPEKKFLGACAETTIAGQKISLLKPQTFMNHSGQSVGAMAHFYRVNPEEILVIHDELDLPEGTVRLKKGGGHGGHNGLRDIISALGSREFWRLRLGIGHPGVRSEVINYVLDTPSKSGRASIEDAIHRGREILPVLIAEGAEKAMNRLHTQP